MKNQLLITVCGLVLGMVSHSTFAASVDFPVGQKNGTFSCTVSASPGTKIEIGTHNVDINGGCSGSKYVTRDGHLAGMPYDEVNTVYFQISKKNYKSGSVSINASEGTSAVSCSNGHDDKNRSKYGDGRFCMTR